MSGALYYGRRLNRLPCWEVARIKVEGGLIWGWSMLLGILPGMRPRRRCLCPFAYSDGVTAPIKEVVFIVAGLDQRWTVVSIPIHVFNVSPHPIIPNDDFLNVCYVEASMHE